MLPQYPNTCETTTEDESLVPIPVWLLTRVSPSTVVIYAHLSRHIGGIRPSLRRVAEESRLSLSTVKRAVALLESIDAVRWRQ
jgi:hypothetical protein